MWSDLLKARPISIWKPITELPRKNPFFNQNQLDGIDTEVQPSFLKFKSTSASIILTQLSFIFLPRSQNCIFVKQIVQNTATLTQSLTCACLQTPSSPGLPYVHKIKAVAPGDQGMYTCVARNVVGRAYAAAYLQVNTAPGHDRWAAILIAYLVINVKWIIVSNN